MNHSTSSTPPPKPTTNPSAQLRWLADWFRALEGDELQSLDQYPSVVCTSPIWTGVHIADDLKRWADEIEAVAQQTVPYNEVVAALRRITSALALMVKMERWRLDSMTDGDPQVMREARDCNGMMAQDVAAAKALLARMEGDLQTEP